LVAAAAFCPTSDTKGNTLQRTGPFSFC